MNTYDFVHLALLALGGQITGRTHLQKKVYFLGALSGYGDQLGYRAHYYGPYSDDVASAVSQLQELGFVDSESMRWRAFDSRGFEVTRTDYKLNSDGVSIAEAKAQQNLDLWKKIESAARRLGQAEDLDYVRLSIAAKTHFMMQKNKPATQEDLVRLAQRFGWKVTIQEINAAFEYLRTLGLADRAA